MSFYFYNVTKSSLHMPTVCTFRNIMMWSFVTCVWNAQCM